MFSFSVDVSLAGMIITGAPRNAFFGVLLYKNVTQAAD